MYTSPVHKNEKKILNLRQQFFSIVTPVVKLLPRLRVLAEPAFDSLSISIDVDSVFSNFWPNPRIPAALRFLSLNDEVLDNFFFQVN